MANRASIEFQLGGINDLAPFISALKPSAQSRIIGQSMGFATKPIVSAAKARVPTDSGALKRAITSIIRRYPEKGYVAGFVGAARGYYSGGRKLKKGQAKKKGYRTPANYSHLVEYGHKRAGGGFVSPKPFLRPAVEAALPAADAELGRGFARAIEAEHRSAARKFGKMSTLKNS